MRAYIACVCALFVLLISKQTLIAQTQKAVTIQQIDKVFLDSNLLLLAANLNIDQQKALEIQSRAYPNPQFSIDANLYDADNNKWLHTGRSGQKVVAFEQMILLGGKRKAEIELAAKNTEQATLQLGDLLRNLKQQLHTGYYSLCMDAKTLSQYNSQLLLLDTIIGNYEIQAKKGNISLKEVVRLKSVYLKLNNDRNEIYQQIEAQQKTVKSLLHSSEPIIANATDIDWKHYLQNIAVDSVMQVAFNNRTDWKLAEWTREVAELNLRYQKKMAIPDLTLGSNYDQRGGAFNNQINFTAAFQLPMWNRNKGNIRYAQIGIKESDALYNNRKSEIETEVQEACNNMLRSINEYKKAKLMYDEGFTEVFDGITNNFMKRNISIVEFVDFFESYNESLAELNRISKQLLTAATMVNYVAGANIY